MTTLPLGSFTPYGTRPVTPRETISLLLGVLSEHAPTEAERYQTKLATMKESHTAEIARLGDTVINRLQRFAPSFCYVGHQVGDENDLGCWIDLGRLHAAEEKGRLIQADSPTVKTRASFILEVGDRVRLWKRKGLVKLWEAAA